MFFEWTWIVGLILGASAGSFLNVVIYRVPRGIPLGKPAKSFCPKCKSPLGVLDLFPLLSWLLLRGRCRHCGAKVSSRYFFVELLTGAIWAGIWYQYLVVQWDLGRAIAYGLAAATLVAVIFIDWELYIIPDQVNAFLMLVGIGFNIWLFVRHDPAAVTWGMPSSLAGMLVGVGALWGVAMVGRLLFGKDAMGHGDIKMARGIGALLFPTMALASFAIAVVLGTVLGVAQVAIRAAATKGQPEEPEDEDDEPYVPESIGSLVKSGIGYLLCLDVIGLAYPKLSISWFGEDPYEPIEDLEDFEVERTMIPFGPYLALGAIAATVFEGQLQGGIHAYWHWALGGPAWVEHLRWIRGL